MFRILVLLLIVAPMAGATVSSPELQRRTAVLEQQERQVWRTLIRNAQFSNVPHYSARSRCEDVRPPQALTTPSPLISTWRDRKVKVSFIIGTDGRVHSPLILESAGPSGDHYVLRAVRTWRYRPATCNGVPTETEGKIEFSSR
jgi:TonB family protein